MMQSAIRRNSLPAVIFLLACFVVPASGQVQSTFTDVHHDVSRPLRDMAKTAPAQAVTAPAEDEPIRPIPIPPGTKPAGDPDPVLQRTAPDAPSFLAPTPGLIFEGVGTGIPGFVIAVTDAAAYARAARLAGQSATQICFQQGTSVGGLCPAAVDGRSPPPAGSP